MRIVVAMTGATGAAYGIRLLAALAELGVERHLILSRWAEVTSFKETGLCAREIGALASVVHWRENQGAPLASGSFRHDGMIAADSRSGRRTSSAGIARQPHQGIIRSRWSPHRGRTSAAG